LSWVSANSESAYCETYANNANGTEATFCLKDYKR
jgi:hypothetical protein